MMVCSDFLYHMFVMSTSLKWMNTLFFTDFKLFFVNYRIEVNEGDQGVQVCLRLGGSDWLVLERPLILELSSDGGTYVC